MFIEKILQRFDGISTIYFLHNCKKVHLVIENYKLSNILLSNMAQIAHKLKQLIFFQTPEKISENLSLTPKISVSKIPGYQDSAVRLKSTKESA